MLSFSEVKYRYHSELFEFDLKVNKGNVVAILGPSGAGKSTLLSLLAGFISPESGDITINNLSLLSQAPHQRPLSMLFQEHNLFAHLSVFDNIGLGIKPNLRLNETEKRSVTQAAQQVGVDELLHRLPEQLSGGQKQRVALARCLVQKKPVLLLDEPFSALDPMLREEMIGLIQRLIEEQQLTVLMVTHSLQDAKALASHYAFVCQHKVLSFGEVSVLAIQEHPSELVRYLKAVK
ncbi:MULTISPECIES: thiamine ABC transporter ATP-binding protein [Aliivibrio]|uniref:Thiamine ABC transporter ATP-binding protein n=1 Tax=Aliivibrio finisterrensis TaxID=511998 RepID=A0A4Q5KS79_9GAMM|nr:MULTISPECIES: thiamine ABC transporter ATP-binding protein [Aliivibrio]MDD9179896.1 thiamine ABC transporter ATP-binding protein [Aliivibrio sp. A6]RYU50089.1 thiamine ABC transporter ATP-binding protein [Aliivibrio finisterrensis]RYU50749.1 thiamine ABC transporter ATP-binding protein [Aliivibrio finisterrensis]RYU56753.1 thiamine ABC transporter ATP-binding protein [Aliivibrio finisterrensis]RYU62804.1 thiamine ABC transporter ATP-binding protein [Aliivibrio finisterrensis]